MQPIGLRRHLFCRRTFLKTLGASAALLPVLDADIARGAGATPKRFLSLTWPNGVNNDQYEPAGAQIDGNLALIKPFSDAGLIPKMFMPIGLEYTHWFDHGEGSKGHDTSPSILTGSWRGSPGVSLDTRLGEHIAKNVQLARRQLNLGVDPGGSDACMTSFRAGGQQNKPELDPYTVFDGLLGGGGGMSSPELDRIRLRRQSVLDFVRGDLTRFSSRLGGEDKVKIEAHLTSLRELELELLPAATNGKCEPPALGPKLDFSGKNNFQLHTKLMLDLVVLAFKCDIARVATVDPLNGQNNDPLSWISSRVHHKIAHDQNGGGRADKIKIDTWFYSQVAYVAKKLDEIQEAGNTALDNSVIYAANLMEDGSSHSVGHVPMLLVGSCGGALKMGGRAVRYQKVPHNQLLAALARGFGMDVQGFGDKFMGVLPDLLA